MNPDINSSGIIIMDVESGSQYESIIIEADHHNPLGNVTSYELLIKTLGEMGFPLKSIDIAILYGGAETVEEALPCLIKSENGWEHHFIPSDSNSKSCVICNEKRLEHAGERSLSPSISESYLSNIPEFNQEYQEGEEVCSICYDQMQETWKHPECQKHWFCLDCIKQYLQIKISEADVLDIRCPGEVCSYYLTAETIEPLISPELKEKYEKFKARCQLNKNPNVRWCTTPNCEGHMIGSETEKHLKCPVCSKEICFVCRADWHPDRTCESVIDSEYNLWAKGKEVQLCPSCKARIEKMDGCNHMTCAVCLYQWCWLCRGKYSSKHFSPLNPFGCPGLQNGSNQRSNWPKSKIYCKRALHLLVWLMIIAFSPLILIGLPAYFFVKELVDPHIDDWANNDCIRFTINGIVFFFAYLLSPIVIAGAIPVGIIGGLGYLIWYGIKKLKS